MIGALPLAAIPPEDEALRPEIRAFLRDAVADIPPERRARSWMGFNPEFSRKLAGRGWLGLTFPREYGGAGRGAFARYVLVEELLAAGAPVSAHWIADRQSGPLIQRFGTEAQRRFYLPRICRAEAFFCIGMSEPNTGSDLASVTTRAVREGDGWRLNGAKIWTTNAQHSHYMIALVRTGGTAADRHKGLSQIIVDLHAPGVRISPIRDLAGDAHFSEVVFEDVFLPLDALIGEEGSGWAQVNAELAFERSGPERVLSSAVLLDEWARWLREASGVGNASEAAEALLGRLLAHLAVLRAMSVAVTGRLMEGESPVVEAALVKDLGTEFEQLIPVVVADILARPGPVPPGPLMRTLAYTAAMAPSFSLRGGTREILRGMIARGMGLR
ncbi:acyl-CoA dehydrogenase family protein [Roseomonas populi]|uniref:Acyl-CoA dehydrogenase family protein n=1 Tax=Roseomonas populi TaxID=3121582 RepID=A0ABT1WZA6_9PROT|nr:acyl-CoA dehydrogenase family protein [Roseomonas pecuniae]MCR0980799.1 acyl-CoA dehydrogenase family protein [Roseomonas pecuniae]